MTDSMPKLGQAALLWGCRPYIHPGENRGSGNRCGHDPEKLAEDRLALPPIKGEYRPSVITKIMKRAVQFFYDPEVMPLIGFHRGGKKNKDGSWRQVRSENREAVALVYNAIAAAVDLASLRVGTYTPSGAFKNLDFDELARRCGLTCLSKDPNDPRPVANSRFYRAIQWLKKAGAIEIFEQYEEKENGDKRARPAIKTLSAKFLRRLGRITGGELKKARKNAYDRVVKFLGKASKFGIMLDSERDKLDEELLSAGVNKALFGKKTARNLEPGRNHQLTTDVANGFDVLKASYDAYCAGVDARIEQKLGRKPKGAEHTRLAAQCGWLTWDAWLKRQAST